MEPIMVYIWLGVVVASLIGEALTLDMTSIWFSVGGVAAIISWFCWNTDTNSIILQVVLFVVISLVCICTLRKVCKNFISRKDTTKTNIQSKEGVRTKLLSDITYDQKGTIRLEDVVWACISENGEEIPAGTIVEVIKVSGNKMVVKVPVLDEEAEKPIPKQKSKKSTKAKFDDDLL